MTGGAGNDTYGVDTAGDTVTEASNAGTDGVLSSIAYTLGTNVENLALAANAGNINGTGNTLNNLIVGNNGDNILDGGAGADALTGGGGVDVFKLGTLTGGADRLMDFLPGTDKIHVNDLTTGLGLGDKDGVIDAYRLVAGPGGFSPKDELIIVAKDISGAITPASAAAAIGSATGAYAKSYACLFAVDNGTDSALFKFVSSGSDAAVSSAELGLVGTLQGTAATGLSDYAFGT
jgi:hypothetical protein